MDRQAYRLYCGRLDTLQESVTAKKISKEKFIEEFNDLIVSARAEGIQLPIDNRYKMQIINWLERYVEKAGSTSQSVNSLFNALGLDYVPQYIPTPAGSTTHSFTIPANNNVNAATPVSDLFIDFDEEEDEEDEDDDDDDFDEDEE